MLPVKELADLGVIGADDASLNPKGKLVGSSQSQEIGGSQRYLPQNHPPLPLPLALTRLFLSVS